MQLEMKQYQHQHANTLAHRQNHAVGVRRPSELRAAEALLLSGLVTGGMYATYHTASNGCCQSLTASLNHGEVSRRPLRRRCHRLSAPAHLPGFTLAPL